MGAVGDGSECAIFPVSGDSLAGAPNFAAANIDIASRDDDLICTRFCGGAGERSQHSILPKFSEVVGLVPSGVNVRSGGEYGSHTGIG